MNNRSWERAAGLFPAGSVLPAGEAFLDKNFSANYNGEVDKFVSEHSENSSELPSGIGSGPMIGKEVQ